VVLSGIEAAPPSGATEARAEDGVEPFSTARLAALRAEGRPVFVNMTAAWCVTCLVNERVAIRTASVRQAFATHGVTYLKGDWTRQDPEITAFLRAHGRDGVPLYVYFPAGNALPLVLPQILTQSILLEEVDRPS
jgi:thiol:disulfide interchange protein DsbD